MLTLPCVVDGPTHTVGSAEGVDPSEPRVMGVRLENHY